MDFDPYHSLCGKDTIKLQDEQILLRTKLRLNYLRDNSNYLGDNLNYRRDNLKYVRDSLGSVK